MDQGDKQHEATAMRREEARKKGQIPKSQDLASASLLLGALLALMYFGRPLVRFFIGYTSEQLKSASLTMDRDTAALQGQEVIAELGGVMLPFLGGLFLMAIAVHLSQVGFLFLPEKLTPDLNRINPLKGAGRILSLSSAARLAFGVFKILVVGAIALWSLWSKKEEVLALGMATPIHVGIFIVDVTLWTCLKIGAALFVLALLDYIYQRWKHEQEIRMTTQEIQEEMRRTHGDPQVIARRRAIQRQLVLNRMSTTIPAADVVVTNPTELAIAIKYDLETMAAPIVVAKGAGVLAQRIRRMALEHGVPIVERKELARTLYKDVELNQQIPAAQYAAVAEVLKYVYDLKGVKLPDPAQAA